MPALKTYDLFISHAWKYGEDYDRLEKLLKNAPYFYCRNYSAPKEKPLELSKSYVTKSEIMDALDRKIRPVNVVLVISGMYYNHREWMQYELDKAYALGKPIIAIEPWGNSMMPTEITAVANRRVGWNTNSIVSAIREVSI